MPGGHNKAAYENSPFPSFEKGDLLSTQSGMDLLQLLDIAS
jgi:hypothetical protein